MFLIFYTNSKLIDTPSLLFPSQNANPEPKRLISAHLSRWPYFVNLDTFSIPIYSKKKNGYEKTHSKNIQRASNCSTANNLGNNFCISGTISAD